MPLCTRVVNTLEKDKKPIDHEELYKLSSA